MDGDRLCSCSYRSLLDESDVYDDEQQHQQHEHRDHEDPLRRCHRERRYTWLDQGHVLSRKLTDYECSLEDDVQKLQDALFSISSHYAKIQFRLRQIACASGDERMCLLRELQRITCQGLDSSKDKDELPTLSGDVCSLGNVRVRQRQIIKQLRSRLTDLTAFTDCRFGIESESSYNLRKYSRYDAERYDLQTSDDDDDDDDDDDKDCACYSDGGGELHDKYCGCIVCREQRASRCQCSRLHCGYLVETFPETYSDSSEESSEQPVRHKPKKRKAKKSKKPRRKAPSRHFDTKPINNRNACKPHLSQQQRNHNAVSGSPQKRGSNATAPSYQRTKYGSDHSGAKGQGRLGSEGRQSGRSSEAKTSPRSSRQQHGSITSGLSLGHKSPRMSLNVSPISKRSSTYSAAQSVGPMEQRRKSTNSPDYLEQPVKRSLVGQLVHRFSRNSHKEASSEKHGSFGEELTEITEAHQQASGPDPYQRAPDKRWSQVFTMHRKQKDGESSGDDRRRPSQRRPYTYEEFRQMYKRHSNQQPSPHQQQQQRQEEKPEKDFGSKLRRFSQFNTGKRASATKSDEPPEEPPDRRASRHNESPAHRPSQMQRPSVAHRESQAHRPSTAQRQSLAHRQSTAQRQNMGQRQSMRQGSADTRSSRVSMRGDKRQFEDHELQRRKAKHKKKRHEYADEDYDDDCAEIRRFLCCAQRDPPFCSDTSSEKAKEPQPLKRKHLRCSPHCEGSCARRGECTMVHDIERLAPNALDKVKKSFWDWGARRLSKLQQPLGLTHALNAPQLKLPVARAGEVDKETSSVGSIYGYHKACINRRLRCETPPQTPCSRLSVDDNNAPDNSRDVANLRLQYGRLQFLKCPFREEVRAATAPKATPPPPPPSPPSPLSLPPRRSSSEQTVKANSPLSSPPRSASQPPAASIARRPSPPSTARRPSPPTSPRLNNPANCYIFSPPHRVSAEYETTPSGFRRTSPCGAPKTRAKHGTKQAISQNCCGNRTCNCPKPQSEPGRSMRPNSHHSVNEQSLVYPHAIGRPRKYPKCDNFRNSSKKANQSKPINTPHTNNMSQYSTAN